MVGNEVISIHIVTSGRKGVEVNRILIHAKSAKVSQRFRKGFAKVAKRCVFVLRVQAYFIRFGYHFRFFEVVFFEKRKWIIMELLLVMS